ncbi:beta-lactamase family protein [Moraxella haemolytica]|uniref:serine hydrolase domain-containing protein n=1 Tax=Moraxella haemolytica TaxID=2904119 RepID=UPI002542F20B|nr:serine hydrolase domain-containing protein [Moraxella sp. ZY171148]WII95864.1 beta-lactamase family protein [Moraxella sp. ZY171148]
MADWQVFNGVLSALQFDESPAGGVVVVYQDGREIVNASVGHALPQMAWQDTVLSVNFSIGKGVLATLVAVLVSKGLLNYDTLISHYWQNFANNGKQSITLRQILTHTSGLFNITALTQSVDDLLDWQAMGRLIENMPIDTPRGQELHNYASAYSALVSGWVIGHTIERVLGMKLQAVLDEYLAKPLGVEGQLYYGVPDDKVHLIAKPVRYFDGLQGVKRKPVLKPDTPMVLQSLSKMPAAAIWRTALNGNDMTTANINKLYFGTSKMNLANYKNALMPNGRDGIEYHHTDVLKAVIPAANGVSTAQALARIYAMHANDGVWQGKTLINSEVLADMRRVQVDGFDAVMPANMRWRTGFHRLFSLQDVSEAYGHMGYNGSVAFCDPKRRLSMAFIHNFDTTMLNDVRQFALSEMAIHLASR